MSVVVLESYVHKNTGLFIGLPFVWTILFYKVVFLVSKEFTNIAEK